MEKIGLVVDTAGDIPRDLVKEYDIREVPFYLYFEGEENVIYKENVTLLPEDFFNIMKAKKKTPKNITAKYGRLLCCIRTTRK